MLSVQNRMRSGSDFTAAVRGGRRAGQRSLVVHYLDRGASGPAPLVSFMVPKSVGNAVVRNRVQRRLRHLMRDRVAALPPGCLVVVRAQPAAALTEDLGNELDRALGVVLRPRASGDSPSGSPRRGDDRSRS